ncbi:conserved hypothetical protein [Rhodospirillaceae bacterium LM-1]|nr:conserved hypothetical protein [Rhodospirillaceae bacterium LM-1]
MTDKISLSLEDFPNPSSDVHGKWAPIYLEPIMGSGERLTIGVAVVAERDFIVLKANMLSRFQCLYGNAGAGVVFLAEAALDALRFDITKRGLEALTEPHPPIAGLKIGDIRNGAGRSLEAIAETWLLGLSSLASTAKSLPQKLFQDSELIVEEARSHVKDRLPLLVAEEVVAKRPGLGSFFRSEIRPDSHPKKHIKIQPHKVNIDFTGSYLVANFCTLSAARPFHAAKEIKMRLWDLKLSRDSSPSALGFVRDHELLVHRPANDDPGYNEKQLANVTEALQELEDQADKEELRLRPLYSVTEMAQRILLAESAANS